MKEKEQERTFTLTVAVFTWIQTSLNDLDYLAKAIRTLFALLCFAMLLAKPM